MCTFVFVSSFNSAAAVVQPRVILKNLMAQKRRGRIGGARNDENMLLREREERAELRGSERKACEKLKNTN